MIITFIVMAKTRPGGGAKAIYEFGAGLVPQSDARLLHQYRLAA